MTRQNTFTLGLNEGDTYRKCKRGHSYLLEMQKGTFLFLWVKVDSRPAVVPSALLPASSRRMKITEKCGKTRAAATTYCNIAKIKARGFGTKRDIGGSNIQQWPMAVLMPGR